MHSDALRGTQRHSEADLAEERGQPQQVELRHVDGELLGQRQSIQQLEVVPKIDARGRLWGEGGWGVGGGGWAS